MRGIINHLRGRRALLERDLERELQYHVDRRVEELVANGVSEPEARRRANLEIGGLEQVRTAVRETWTWPTVDALALDFRYALRSLTKSRGFTVGVGAVLALAIGATTAIFSVISTVLLDPLPYPDAERIVSIETRFTNTDQSSQFVSAPDFLDWQAQNDVFENMAVLFSATDYGVQVDGRAFFANPKYVSADFFSVFGQTASVGRLLNAQDIPTAGADGTTAVLAHAWAAAQFGSAEAALGQTLTLVGGPLEIVGVAPPGFDYPRAADLWVPFNPAPRPGVPDAMIQDQRANMAYEAVAKLKPGVPFASAEAQLRTIGDELAQQHPQNRVKTVALVPLHERLTGGVRGTLWILMGAVGVLWLIACTNIANLLLARAAGRTREIALRASLGAGQSRVVRLLLVESFLLAGASALAGVALTFLLVRGIVTISPADLPRIEEVRVDAAVFLFAFGLSLVSVAFFGLMPALQASRLNLSDALKQGGAKATVSRTSTQLRSGLVVAEIALSVILLVTAGLLVRSFLSLQQVDLGFTTDRVLAAYTDHDAIPGAGVAERLRFHAEVLDRLRVVPGVEAASAVGYLGMGWEPRALRDVFVEGRPEQQAGERPQAEFHAVAEDYFKTLNVPLLAGRDFARTDTPEAAGVVIINESLARALFPGESPLGQRITTFRSTNPYDEIVGVVGDTRWQEPSQPAPPVVYAASMQGIGNEPAILARTSLDEASLAATLRLILNEVNPAVPVKLATLEEMFESTLAYPKFRTRIIGLFAGLATVLAAVGIFSVLVYLVGLRFREIALRQALGARAVDVMRLIAGQGLRLITLGLVLGLAGALAASQLLTSLLFEIHPWDVGTYLGTIFLLGSVGFIATLVPVIRASRITPVTVLQQD
jgi:putative ABC transport system permease protein